MALSAFLNMEREPEILDINKYGLPKPDCGATYLQVADRIQEVFTRYVARNELRGEDYVVLMRLAGSIFGVHLRDFIKRSKHNRLGSFTERFLDETYQFVTEGCTRDLDIRTWECLLDGPEVNLNLNTASVAEDNHTEVNLDLGKPALDRLIGVYDPSPRTIRKGESGNLRYQYLCDWMSRENGFRDMMLVIRYLYGKQSLLTKIDNTVG